MDKIDQLYQRLEFMKTKLKITDLDEQNIESAMEDWMVEKIQNKLKEEGWSNDEKCI